MDIANGGHYHNTSTGKDQGDKIDVAEGGKWTNDGESAWGQVDINGGATNNGDLIIGNGDDKDDDFYIGLDGSLENKGHIDAGNSGTADIEGDLINGSLTPDGKPDDDASIKFDDAVVHPGGKLWVIGNGDLTFGPASRALPRRTIRALWAKASRSPKRSAHSSST